VDKVIWPFKKDFAQYELGQQQMEGCGGLFSFTLKDPALKKIEAFCNSLQHILMAVSWGGHESLIIPSIAAIPESEYDAGEYNRYQLIRMYVGLEEPEYLIKDLEQALEKIA
jgi:cystathionine beta-lyase/cystathionine gamma-synthase